MNRVTSFTTRGATIIVLPAPAEIRARMLPSWWPLSTGGR